MVDKNEFDFAYCYFLTFKDDFEKMIEKEKSEKQ